MEVMEFLSQTCVIIFLLTSNSIANCFDQTCWIVKTNDRVFNDSSNISDKSIRQNI